MPPLERDFSKTLKEIKRAILRKEFSDKVGRAMGTAGYLIAVQKFYTDLAFNLQHQLAYEAAMSTEVQTKCATHRKVKCLLGTMQRCAGKGRLNWEAKLGVPQVLEEMIKRGDKELDKVRFNRKLWNVTNRGQIRIWVRTHKQFINRIEQYVEDNTFCNTPKADGKRIWFHKYATDCVEKGTLRFRDDPLPKR